MFCLAIYDFVVCRVKAPQKKFVFFHLTFHAHSMNVTLYSFDKNDEWILNELNKQKLDKNWRKMVNLT